ncbi:WD_REPEATS_REGION domain-containing protein [Caerostris extrusa]|uniref:WD_REPEATS_REGION domain-containing protein n=1 Tax=Caerostris extrusa TaxID=172846 RepID=A0AAV4QRH5_CAEEX|nr:WD_REPEATS_REGION domain-containing protein [Caerostris extrusa]
MASSESQETTEKHHVTSSTAASDWANAVIYGNIKIIAKYEGENPPLCCVVLPNSKEFAVGWSDGIIEIRDTTSFGVKRSFEGPENLPVTCVSASELNPAKPMLLASYASGHTVLWDMKEGQKLSTIHNDRQTLVNTFNTDNAAYAVSGSDAKIQIYDTETSTEQQILQERSGAGWGIAHLAYEMYELGLDTRQTESSTSMAQEGAKYLMITSENN